MSTSTVRLVYRHMTGLEYDAEPRTDATWTEAGVKVVHPSGRARRWHYRPRLQRAAIRWAWTAAALAEGYGLAVDSSATVIADQGAVVGGTVVAGYKTVQAARHFRHRRRVVKPLAKALARPLENGPENVLRTLVVPLRTDRPEAVVSVPVPDGWHGDRREDAGIIAARLGGDWRAEWRMHQAPFTAVFTKAPEPPGRVTFADLQGAIEACGPAEVVVGLNNQGKPVRGDFVRDEPMWGLSIGSGGGKSVFLWCVVAQLVKQGATIVGVDPKYVSLDPLVGVPGVTIHNDPRNVGAMWKAIADFRAEMEARFEAWTNDRTLEFPRMVLVIEEGNMFSDLSKDLWKEVKGPKDPAQPPVWRDIAAILRMGRQANANVIAVFQRMTDQATGGQGLRDSFGFRLLGRYTWQAWASLVGTTPVPKSSKKRGRFIVVDNGDHTWIQAPYATSDEIHAYCMAARAEQGWTADTDDTGVSQSEDVPEVNASDVDQNAAAAGIGTPPLTLVKGGAAAADAPDVPLYSLPDAIRGGLVSCGYEALRKAAQRPGFPEPAERGRINRWTEEAFREFEASRSGASTADEKEEGAS